MNTPDQVGVEFTRLALWNHRIERFLGGEEEIPVNQLHCLMILYLEKPLSASELACHLGIRDTSLSKLLRSLESFGAVRRSRDPTDRRIERVALTASGERIAERTLSRAAAVGRQLLESLPEERRAQFMRCLGVITTNSSTSAPVEIAGGREEAVHTHR